MWVGFGINFSQAPTQMDLLPPGMKHRLPVHLPGFCLLGAKLVECSDVCKSGTKPEYDSTISLSANINFLP